MKPSALVALAIVAAVSAFGSSSAFAQSVADAVAPIQVVNFQYAQTDPGSRDSSEIDRPGVMVTFKNVTSRPVHEVVFAVSDASGYQLATVSRHGTFAPGVTVTRYFGDIRPKEKHGDPAKATPVEVGFKDGSTWQSPK